MMLREEVGILVIDDVNAMRVQIRELLKSAGFKRITLASNGDEAKQLIECGKYHLVLSDWHMAPTDGMELLKYLRAHPDYKDIAFIMVSAENTRERVVEAIKAGTDDYLIKPLTPVQIESKVF
jgi:two-component system, chemotaxis family, chemotaxis protein CheY